MVPFFWSKKPVLRDGLSVTPACVAPLFLFSENVQVATRVQCTKHGSKWRSGLSDIPFQHTATFIVAALISHCLYDEFDPVVVSSSALQPQLWGHQVNRFPHPVLLSVYVCKSMTLTALLSDVPPSKLCFFPIMIARSCPLRERSLRDIRTHPLCLPPPCELQLPCQEPPRPGDVIARFV